jgi:hypothetical protein
MKSTEKNRKLDLLRADSERLLSQDLMKVKGGIVPCCAVSCSESCSVKKSRDSSPA